MSSDNSELPFYIRTMDHKRCSQIIKETKAEIKKMESLRPSTPFGKRLFQNHEQFGLQSTSRPSSSTSIKSLRYEQEEKHKILNPISSFEKSKKSLTKQDVKLEPIITKPVLCFRRSSSSSLKNKNDIEFSRFPPLSTQEQNNRLSSKDSTEESRRHSKDSLSGEEKFIPVNQNLNYSSESLDHSSLNEPYFSELVSSSGELSKDNENEELEELSQNLSFLFPSLEMCIKQGNKKQIEEKIMVIKEIYMHLERNNAFIKEFSNRTHLLKLLFKLLNSNVPDLSIKVIGILLKMKMKDNNLTNLFRLAFKLMKEDCWSKYDDGQVIDIILESMNDISIATDKGATIYCLKILKQIICSEDLNCELVEKCIIVICHHLKEINHYFCMANEWDYNHNQIIIQFLMLLHCSAGNEKTRGILIQCDSLHQVLKTLHSFYEHADIVQIAVRFISKFLDTEGCKVLTDLSDADLLLNFLYVLELHKYYIDIALQVTFIIGNLVSANDKTAFIFLKSPNFINIMVEVLDVYVNEHIQFKENVSECFRNSNSSGDSNWTNEIFEVILKVLCVWANICLSLEVGTYLASEELLISHLLSVIGAYTEKASVYDTNFALYSFLVVIGNIAYYLPSSSDICTSIAEYVITLLDPSFSHEVQLESANIIRNLTRHQEVRKFIQDNSLFPEFMKLLNASDKEFKTAAYGIIMNLLIDQSTHQMFYQEQGITRVLHKLHLCTERDWKTSSLMCQILWNYCNGCNSVGQYISKLEVQHLIKFLSYSIYKVSETIEKEGTSYSDWKDEFCPVAQKLLHLLETRFII
ncbi:armadillo repeat-containing protein 2 isoform X4 [Parasteatoda tepidariorum]|nr:armadillo repeat-containing protein 2-like isoform X3 [Parasteatoda tepidariorum]